MWNTDCPQSPDPLISTKIAQMQDSYVDVYEIGNVMSQDSYVSNYTNEAKNPVLVMNGNCILSICDQSRFDRSEPFAVRNIGFGSLLRNCSFK